MLTTIERQVACWLLMATIVAGFLVPGLSEFFHPFAFAALLCMIVLSLVPMGRMDFNEVFTLDSKVWQVVMWQLFVLPAIIVAAATLAKLSAPIITLMVTTASAGSLFASPTFAELLQVNKRKALQCMILSTFLMPASYFVFLTLVMHSDVHFDVIDYVQRCATFLVYPLGIFLVYMAFARSIPPRVVEIIEQGSRRITIFA